MLSLRRCVAVLVVSGMAGACSGGLERSSSPCPSGQDLREERYNATSIKSRGCIGPDSENNYRRQGHWEFFHPNGQKSGEGSYVDGFQGGATDDTGILRDGREGAWVFWHNNGQKSLEGTFCDGEPEGLLTEWYDNGQRSQEGSYRDGEREGLRTEWYENGQKEGESTYRDGLAEGLLTEWYDNGQKELEGTYLNGTLMSATRWDANGTQTTTTR